jgi:DNA-directed RNA polymerase subunit RPC12/RpoP
VLVIRCAKCRAKLFRYKKIGDGRVLHCWKDRILEDHSKRSGDEVRCPCGSLIGIDEKKWIKMKQAAFTCSGSVTRR